MATGRNNSWSLFRARSTAADDCPVLLLFSPSARQLGLFKLILHPFGLRNLSAAAASVGPPLMADYYHYHRHQCHRPSSPPHNRRRHQVIWLYAAAAEDEEALSEPSTARRWSNVKVMDRECVEQKVASHQFSFIRGRVTNHLHLHQQPARGRGGWIHLSWQVQSVILFRLLYYIAMNMIIIPLPPTPPHERGGDPFPRRLVSNSLCPPGGVRSGELECCKAFTSVRSNLINQAIILHSQLCLWLY